MTKPTFQIVRSSPTYCPITDGLVGSTRRVERYCETEAYARKVAGMLEGDDREHGGDDFFLVQPVGDVWADLYRPRPRFWTEAITVPETEDDFPF